MPRIRRFLDLAASERETLFSFTYAHDPERFPDFAAMEQGYLSSAFEHGETQFSAWEDDRPLGAMGAVIRDVPVRSEAFITAVALEPDQEDAFEPLLSSTFSCIPRADDLVVRIGISPRHPHLETLVARSGFAADYDGLIMSRAADPLEAPGEGNWRVEILDQGNREAYRRVMDEAFRHSPNGASVTEEQITELMAETSHPDLLGLALLDGAPAAAYELCLQEEVGWIEAVAVAREMQGRRLGRRMVAEAIARLRAYDVEVIKLLVMSSNEPAVRLYRNCGFTVESVTSRWWRRELQSRRPASSISSPGP